MPQRKAAPMKVRAAPAGKTPRPVLEAAHVAMAIPAGLPIARPRATPVSTRQAPAAWRSADRETPAAVKANRGSTTYEDHGATACSARSAGDSSRSAAAERLRLAQSHTGSCCSSRRPLPTFFSSRSACSSSASAVAAWASRGPGLGTGLGGRKAARAMPLIAPLTPARCSDSQSPKVATR